MVVDVYKSLKRCNTTHLDPPLQPPFSFPLRLQRRGRVLRAYFRSPSSWRMAKRSGRHVPAVERKAGTSQRHVFRGVALLRALVQGVANDAANHPRCRISTCCGRMCYVSLLVHPRLILCFPGVQSKSPFPVLFRHSFSFRKEIKGSIGILLIEHQGFSRAGGMPVTRFGRNGWIRAYSLGKESMISRKRIR